MKILVTNDDGIDSAGIKALAEAMSRVGTVLIVAPDQEQSGVGTAVSFHNGIAAAERTSAIEGTRSYAVSGTPSDCVILGIGPLAEGKIDLVVSGINTGANVGNGVLGSGTAMATRVAHTRRIPSIAVSLSLRGPRDQREPLFSLAATVSELLARSMAEGEMPSGITLNVNVPSVPRGESRGIAVTRLSPVSYWRLRTETGRRWPLLQQTFRHRSGPSRHRRRDRCLGSQSGPCIHHPVTPRGHRRHPSASADGAHLLLGVRSRAIVGNSVTEHGERPPGNVVCSLNMFGDAVRDLLDPRLRGAAGRLDAHRW